MEPDLLILIFNPNHQTLETFGIWWPLGILQNTPAGSHHLSKCLMNQKLNLDAHILK